MLIGEVLAYNARNEPDGLALVFEDRRITWRALNEGANRCANALSRLGVGRGDRVAYALGNSVAFVELFYGLAKLGAIGAPMMPASVGGEIAYVVNDLGARVVLGEASVAPAIAALSGKLPTVEHAIGIGDGHRLGLDYDRLVADAPAEEPEVGLSPDDDLAIKYTSGTTGAPKGCVRTHRQLLMSNLGNLFQVPHDKDERYIICSPMAAGSPISLLTMHFLRGNTVVLMPRFDAETLFRLIERERVTILHATFTIFKRIVSHPDLGAVDLSSLRYFTGNAANGAETRAGLMTFRENRSFKGRFYASFGATECGGRISYLMPEDSERALSEPASAHHLESIGREARLCRIACMDEDMREVPTGEIGQMAIKAPTVFKQYWNRPEETAKAFRDGWMVMGDLLRRDEAGFFYLSGRTADMIKTGGINVYPAEIEPVLAAHPKVRDAAVVGVPDPEWGEAVVACVVAEPGVSEAELIEHCRARLAAYKRPKAVRFLDALPLTGNGKVLKKDLKAMLIAERGG